MADRRDYYSNWYDENKDGRNERRRKKYASDAGVRARERERVRKYRANQTNPAEIGRIFREKSGVRIEVFRVGDVAQKIGAHASVIRRYEKAGLLPSPTFPGEHRLYTKGQVELIAEICDWRRNTRYSWRRPQKAVQEQALVAKVKALWGKA